MPARFAVRCARLAAESTPSIVSNSANVRGRAQHVVVQRWQRYYRAKPVGANKRNRANQSRGRHVFGQQRIECHRILIQDGVGILEQHQIIQIRFVGFGLFADDCFKRLLLPAELPDIHGEDRARATIHNRWLDDVRFARKVVDGLGKGFTLLLKRFSRGPRREQVIAAKVTDKAAIIRRQCALMSQDFLEDIFDALDILKVVVLVGFFGLGDIVRKLRSRAGNPLANRFAFLVAEWRRLLGHPHIIVRFDDHLVQRRLVGLARDDVFLGEQFRMVEDAKIPLCRCPAVAVEAAAAQDILDRSG